MGLNELVTVGVLCFIVFVSLGQSKSLRVSRILNDGDETPFKHCGKVRAAGYTSPGPYRLQLGNNLTVVTHCQLGVGGTTTRIMRQQTGGVSFQRRYWEYEDGFGKKNDNFWLGLKAIHALTNDEPAGLVIWLRDFHGVVKKVEYLSFYVGDKLSGYRMDVAQYQAGDIGDMLQFNHGAKFYTFDQTDGAFCANHTRAGWWFNMIGDTCTHTLLTGRMYPGGFYNKTGPQWDGAFWLGWLGMDYAYNYVEMVLVHSD